MYSDISRLFEGLTVFLYCLRVMGDKPIAIHQDSKELAKEM